MNIIHIQKKYVHINLINILDYSVISYLIVIFKIEF